MAMLTIVLAGYGTAHDIPLMVEVVDHDLASHWRKSLTTGQTASVTLPPGYYAARARTPAGRVVSSSVELRSESDQQTVQLKVGEESPSEQMAWTYATAQATPRDAQRLRPYQLRSLWMRLWQQVNNRWLVASWPKQTPPRYSHTAQYRFPFQGTQMLYYLQIGGPKMPWRLIALPADDLYVLIQPVDQAAADEAPVTVTVASQTQQAEALLGYMKRGAFYEARTVDQAIVAEDLLNNKRKNPTAAAVGGYYLLRIGDLARLHTWTENLANWMHWMPDGAVIHGWHLLRQDQPDVAGARARFLEAANRGVPVYTEGVRLLYDGLVMFDDDAEGKDDDVHAALAAIRRYAANVDWTISTTTFRGRTPIEPTSERLTGYPESNDHVVFFALNVVEQDLEWLGLVQPGASAIEASATRGLESAQPQASERDTPYWQALQRIARGEKTG